MEDLLKRTGDEHSPLSDKKDLMNELVKSAQVNTLGKQNQLQEALREVSSTPSLQCHDALVVRGQGAKAAQ